MYIYIYLYIQIYWYTTTCIYIYMYICNDDSTDDEDDEEDDDGDGGVVMVKLQHFWKNPVFQIAVPCFCPLAFCSCKEDTAAPKTIVLKLCRVSWRLKNWGWCFPLLWLRSTLVSATAVCPWTSWQEAFRGLEFMWTFYARDSGDYGPSSGPTCCFCSFNPSQPGSKLPFFSFCVDLWIWSL